MTQKGTHIGLGHCSPLPASTLKGQKQFFLVLVTTVSICVVISIFFQDAGKQTMPAYAPDHRYLIAEVVDGRRLGNQMFNYASLLGIARRNNMTAVMPSTFKLRRFFDLPTPNGTPKTIGAYLDFSEFGRRACAYDRRTEHLQWPFSINLQGYYQSWKYFEGYEKEVRESFQIKPQFKHQATDILARLAPHAVTDRTIVRVGVHVRRGDINTQQNFINYGYTVADPAYISHAMDYFRSRYNKLLFVVCTDDKDWCRLNVKGDDVVISDNKEAVVDFALLTMCDHTIMTVGSFGWWAAWFINGTTIYYEKWPRPVSVLEYNVDKKEYFPPHWIPMV